MGPLIDWLDVPLGLACLLVGAGYLAMLVGRRAPVPSAAAHAVMGFGMAAMFLPTFDPVPHAVWIAVFVVTGAWFGAEVLRAGRLAGTPGSHVVGAAAMLFMLLGGHEHAAIPVGPVDPEHAHHAASDGSGGLLVTVLALAFAAWYVTVLVRLPAHRRIGAPAVEGGAPVLVATRIDAHVVMSVAMSVAMLVMLLGMA